eukprot:COSAG01_NODE_1096_length_11713_cov_213.007060_7_plen_151_part_00
MIGVQIHGQPSCRATTDQHLRGVSQTHVWAAAWEQQPVQHGVKVGPTPVVQPMQRQIAVAAEAGAVTVADECEVPVVEVRVLAAVGRQNAVAAIPVVGSVGQPPARRAHVWIEHPRGIPAATRAQTLVGAVVAAALVVSTLLAVPAPMRR